MTDRPEADTIPEISATELAERIRRGDPPRMVDVREPFEREIADLPDVGQLRIPLAELGERLAELEGPEEVVLYCRSGSRSGHATLVLRQRGMRHLVNLKGGLLAWSEEVDPSVPRY